MESALSIIGAINNIFFGLEMGLGWWVIHRIMSRLFG